MAKRLLVTIFCFPIHLSAFTATRCCTRFGLQGSQWIAGYGYETASLSSPLMSSFSFKHEHWYPNILVPCVQAPGWPTLCPTAPEKRCRLHRWWSSSDPPCACAPSGYGRCWQNETGIKYHIILKVLFNNDSRCGWVCMSTYFSANSSGTFYCFVRRCLKCIMLS